MGYRNWADLKAKTVEAQVLVVELQDLKDLLGVKRLGTNVLNDIATRLRDEHLTYFPEWILDYNAEPRQTQQVWLTPATDTNLLHKVVRAVQDPDQDRVADLRAILDGNDALARLEDLKTRFANVRAALEDAMESLGDGAAR
ncbi:hypothetical protein APR04_002999 [Promicromonospora umidemergens]|uniref:Uncharacterized protein n=1 Tax=Promicromonospora umidemergens TaxID=629679 RepID=A0ABP8WGR8_9MICO|nr:hypothetical protein [Promicromonospora umidemergens]MCP2284079.1 hypothetical protein [Promicromonospora umidemergens]